MVDPPSRRVFIRCLTGDGVSMVFDCRDDRPRELQRRWTVAHHPGEGCKFSDLVALENRARPNSCDIRFDRTRFLSLSLPLSLSLSFFLSLYLVSLASFPSLDFYEVEERFASFVFPTAMENGRVSREISCFTG